MIYLGDHVALTRTIFGHKMYVDTRDVSLTPHILLDGAWEPWTADVLRSIIRPGMTTVAVEANPETFRLLARSLEVNGYKSISDAQPLGVMAARGALAFRRLREHLGSSSFYVSAEVAAQ